MTGQIKLHCWTSVALVALIALVALATLGSGGMQAALAADPSDATSPMEWRHGTSDPLLHGPESAMFQALHRLNLSDAQTQQIRAISADARARWNVQSASDSTSTVALGNPGDPNHAAAVEEAKTRAAQRVEDLSDVQQMIYAVLTPDQQAQLPQVLADLQTRYSRKVPPIPAGNSSGS